jgi:hypothetical protein
MTDRDNEVLERIRRGLLYTESESVAVGSPCRVLRPVTDEDREQTGRRVD